MPTRELAVAPPGSRTDRSKPITLTRSGPSPGGWTVSIQYAATALTVPSGNATVTGTIENDTNGVSGPAQDSNGTCSNGTVTATPVNWGTTTGPAPTGSGPDVSGCVTYQPWVGE